MEYTHAYVHYLSDKSKELIECSQFVNSKFKIKRKAEVKWFNEKTQRFEIYEAYIHLLGTSEEDIDQQIVECKKQGIRFCLPTSKTIQSVEDEDSDDDFIMEKKAKIELAKIKIKKEILTENKHILLKKRTNLELDDELHDGNSTNSMEKNGLEESDENRRILEPQNQNNKENIIRSVETENGARKNQKIGELEKDDNEENIIPSGQTENGARTNQNSLSESQGQNNGENTNRPMETGNDSIENPVRTIKLKKYDTYNDQIYLGGGILLEIDEWKSVKASKNSGCFVINLATAIWRDDLKDMCLDEKRAKPRQTGQVRKEIPAKMLKAMEDLYEDRLRNQGCKGRKKLQDMVKTVRRTLTWKINDLNKGRKEEVVRDDVGGVDEMEIVI